MGADPLVVRQEEAYCGLRKAAQTTFRLVGVLDEETGEYHLYVTNIPPERLGAEEIASTYRARWYVELLMAELKSGYRIDQIPTRKKAAVEAFIYAAVITLLASRRLLAAARRRHGSQAHRVTPVRWARLFRAHAQEILAILVAPPRHVRHLRRVLETTMLHEALDPHLHRPDLVRQVENRTSWRCPAA